MLSVAADAGFLDVMREVTGQPLLKHSQDVKKYIKSYHYNPEKKLMVFEMRIKKPEGTGGAEFLDEKTLQRLSKYVTLQGIARKLEQLNIEFFDPLGEDLYPQLKPERERRQW